jgi:hypothetical protein
VVGVSPIFGESEEEKRREEAKQQQREQMNLQASQAEADRPMDKAYIDKMTDHELEQGTIDVLSNLLDQDFLLGNMTDAEVHEYRWLARVLRLEVEAMHPAQESIFQEDIRMVAYDDRKQRLPALDEVDKSIIEQFLMAVIARATRGKDGWQQEMFNKTITASETRQVDDNDDGGFL